MHACTTSTAQGAARSQIRSLPILVATFTIAASLRPDGAALARRGSRIIRRVQASPLYNEPTPRTGPRTIRALGRAIAGSYAAGAAVCDRAERFRASTHIRPLAILFHPSMKTSGTPLHSFADRMVSILKSDPRFIGLLVGGSFSKGDIDDYSDLDLVLVVEEDHYSRVMATRHDFAASLGHLLYAFTGEHVGEPRLLICLYADPLMHVDLKFVTLDELDKRIEEPLVLWHRDDRIPQRLPYTIPRWPSRESEWFEEWFWVWVHYTAAKLGRGELLETHVALAQIRLLVLGPMAARRIGNEQRGLRRLEMLAPEISRQLATTVGDYSAAGCATALHHTIMIYRDFRTDALPRNQKYDAETAVIEFVDRIIANASARAK